MGTDESPDTMMAKGSESAKLRVLLSDPHARYLLEYLRKEPGPVSLSTAATHVAAGVTDTPPAAVPKAVSDRVQTFLHHGHVPELARHGVVAFDREDDTVSMTR